MLAQFRNIAKHLKMLDLLILMTLPLDWYFILLGDKLVFHKAAQEYHNH